MYVERSAGSNEWRVIFTKRTGFISWTEPVVLGSFSSKQDAIDYAIQQNRYAPIPYGYNTMDEGADRNIGTPPPKDIVDRLNRSPAGWLSDRYTRSNPPGLNTELVIGGLAALVLVGFGIYLIAEANDSSEDTSSELEDTSALATLATVVP